MSTTATPLVELDRDITAAMAHLKATRRRRAHSPNGDTERAVRDAEEHLNGLLELRHML